MFAYDSWADEALNTALFEFKAVTVFAKFQTGLRQFCVAKAVRVTPSRVAKPGRVPNEAGSSLGNDRHLCLVLQTSPASHHLTHPCRPRSLENGVSYLSCRPWFLLQHIASHLHKILGVTRAAHATAASMETSA